MMTLTTMGGFLSFVTSDLQAFVRFGIAAAFGIGAGLLLCFSVLPVLLLRLPPRPAPDRSDPGVLENVLVRLARGVERRSGLVLAGTAPAGLGLGFRVLKAPVAR